MYIELTYDYAPEQILIPLELRGKPIYAIISDEPAAQPKAKRSFAQFLLSMPTDDSDEEIFVRDTSTISRGTEEELF